MIMNLLAKNQHRVQNAQDSPACTSAPVKQSPSCSLQVVLAKNAQHRGNAYIDTDSGTEAVHACGHHASTTCCEQQHEEHSECVYDYECKRDGECDCRSNIKQEESFIDADEKGRLMHWLRGFAAAHAFESCFVLKQNQWHVSEHGLTCSTRNTHSKGSSSKRSRRDPWPENSSEAETLCDNLSELGFKASPNNIIVLSRGTSAETMRRNLRCGTREASLQRNTPHILSEILQGETCYSFHVLW
jgi:hypothetical protein